MLNIYKKISSSHPIQIAIAWAILNGFTLAFIGVSAKYLSDDFNSIEIIFQRSSVALIIIILLLIISRNISLVRTNNFSLHAKRSLTGLISVAIIFHAFSLIPIAEATAIVFFSPVIATILSIIFLGERVGINRIIAMIVGFIGVITIISPTGDNILLYGSLVALLGAFTSALVKVQLRSMGKSESSVTTIFYFMLFCTLVSGAYVAIFSDISALNFTKDDVIFAIMVIAVSTVISQMGKTEALKLSEVSIITPLEYLSIIWTIFLGVIIFGDIPAITTYIGASMIIASNIYIIYRERKNKND